MYTGFDWIVGSGVVVAIVVALYGIYELRRIRRAIE